ncbi:MAG: hypothetical protein Q7S46_11670, partial [Gallionella sp.]|nr:hypothetical protein [Gallionella sp.]
AKTQQAVRQFSDICNWIMAPLARLTAVTMRQRAILAACHAQRGQHSLQRRPVAQALTPLVAETLPVAGICFVRHIYSLCRSRRHEERTSYVFRHNGISAVQIPHEVVNISP